jgi:PBP1b-binding outer membrane lipoprotein LpoB
MKNVLKALTLCLFVAFMTSCQTKEERVINRMNALADRIENQTESFTDEEWEVINSDFEMLKAQAQECNFTSEQRTAYTKAETEVTTAILKQRATEVGNDFKNAIDQGKDMFNGIIDGIKEGLGGGEEATQE